MDDQLLCPRCSQTKFHRSGNVCGRQRFQCLSCNYHFTQSNYLDQGTRPFVRFLSLALRSVGFPIHTVPKCLPITVASIRYALKRYQNPTLPRTEISEARAFHTVESAEDLKRFIDQNTSSDSKWILIHAEDFTNVDTVTVLLTLDKTRVEKVYEYQKIQNKKKRNLTPEQKQHKQEYQRKYCQKNRETIRLKARERYARQKLQKLQNTSN